ncbi:GH15 family glucan-1,4-alpha-glucosidase [Streptomyces achromogenes]|uniref:GH15 family glucan-1,4-alpha-glucosidase n=1 Tax=Streptomyces achromogenes TaxID=67255 RepID=A0ABU0Q9P7_STRAH|nr:trehalase-like domain-containing protein [Streptomyces achromogenes]MDQ0687372.1 GH15 family glucan-1,4-alpha-glucosidase [Streptomyces achromogenes]
MDGYTELRNYAVIGDGRCVTLIARDGSVDWLAWPDLDSPTVFAAVLDHLKGGRFLLRPEAPYTASRRYLPGTNVLETTFTTTRGTVRVTDALTIPDSRSLAPARELVRRIEGLGGQRPNALECPAALRLRRPRTSPDTSCGRPDRHFRS